MLSKKDYVAVARVLNDAIVNAGGKAAQMSAERKLRPVAEGLADYFQSDNPRFDRQRFLYAVCGGKG